jgi:ComF family protein
LAPGFFDGYVAVGAHQGPLRAAIHALKYDHESRIAAVLGDLLADAVLRQNWPVDMIIPVPLHLNKLRQRGYNQANKIAQALAARIGSPVASEAIQRTRETLSQVELSAHDRRINVQGAFAVAANYRQELTGKSVILLDDVCTTGSTLTACAIALREVDVASIYAATVSRAHFIPTGRAEDSLNEPTTEMFARQAGALDTANTL